MESREGKRGKSAEASYALHYVVGNYPARDIFRHSHSLAAR